MFFSCEYCEIFKNTYFEEHLKIVASVSLHKLPQTCHASYKLGDAILTCIYTILTLNFY